MWTKTKKYIKTEHSYFVCVFKLHVGCLVTDTKLNPKVVE